MRSSSLFSEISQLTQSSAQHYGPEEEKQQQSSNHAHCNRVSFLKEPQPENGKKPLPQTKKTEWKRQSERGGKGRRKRIEIK